jgi:endonuclease III related protein
MSKKPRVLSLNAGFLLGILSEGHALSYNAACSRKPALPGNSVHPRRTITSDETNSPGSVRDASTVRMTYPSRSVAAKSIRAYYRTLHRAWGPQHWWPADTPFEVITGAYLTQNTSWTNVEKALANLRAADVLSIDGIRNTPLFRLESLIRSAGYFRQKAHRLKTFVAFLDERYDGSLEQMFRQPTLTLREELLALHGVGPETADSILLYGGHHPIFVVDAYTRRIFHRHEIIPESAGYDEIRALVEQALAPLAKESPTRHSASVKQRGGPAGASHPPSPMSTAQRSPLSQVNNEMHGLLVGVGKNFCLKSQPNCDDCPLRKYLPAQP